MALKFTNSQLVAMALAGHFLGGAVPVVGSFPQEQVEIEESQKTNQQHPMWTEEEIQQISKLDPSLSKWMTNQLIEFGTSPENNELNSHRKKETIKAFENISLENQPLFSAFLKEQQLMTFEWAKQLAQVSPQNWATTFENLENQLMDFLQANQAVPYEWIKQLAHVPAKDWVTSLKDLENEFSTFLKVNQVTNPEWVKLLAYIPSEDRATALKYYQGLDFLEANHVTNFEWAEQLVKIPAQDWAVALQNLQRSGTLNGGPANN